MRRFIICSLAAFFCAATSAHAQTAGYDYGNGIGYDYSKGIGYDFSKPIGYTFSGVGAGSAGWNGNREDRTKVKSPKDKERERREKNRDDANKNLKDRQNDFDDHVKRMRDDNDSRGMKPYVPGWIRYREGRQVDPTYERLKNDLEAARRAANTAKELYDAAR